MECFLLNIDKSRKIHCFVYFLFNMQVQPLLFISAKEDQMLEKDYK